MGRRLSRNEDLVRDDGIVYIIFVLVCPWLETQWKTCMLNRSTCPTLNGKTKGNYPHNNPPNLHVDGTSNSPKQAIVLRAGRSFCPIHHS